MWFCKCASGSVLLCTFYKLSKRANSTAGCRLIALQMRKKVLLQWLYCIQCTMYKLRILYIDLHMYAEASLAILNVRLIESATAVRIYLQNRHTHCNCKAWNSNQLNAFFSFWETVVFIVHHRVTNSLFSFVSFIIAFFIECWGKTKQKIIENYLHARKFQMHFVLM